MTFNRRAVIRAIELHAPPGFVPALSESAWRDLENDGLDCGAFVVAADIRGSTSLMKEAVDLTGFARALHEYTMGARDDAWATNGWFDKFTGDGFIAYWPEVNDAAAGTRIREALEFCRRTQARFPGVMKRFRENSQNLPADSGLALGLDSGDCRLAMVGTDLTVIGSPVVGAVRMVGAADAGQLIANVHPGDALNRDFAGIPGLKATRTVVSTKEYEDGQEAYIVRIPATPAISKRVK